MTELERIPDSGLPVFESDDWNEHVEVWRSLDSRIQDDKWRMAAVAASLTATWGEKGEVMARFAHEAGTSGRRVYEYAATWKAWASRERSQTLSFHHHTIAARSEDPEGAIEAAEVEELSTRQLERRIKPEEPEATETMRCPRCGGTGEVPVE